MYINRKMICLLLVLSQYAFAWLDEVNLESKNIKLISMHEMRFCFISFVSIDGKKYIVKQKKPLHKLLGAVRDAITAHMVESFCKDYQMESIAHRVAIIPAGIDFPGKWRADWPATLHTIAPGKMIKEQKSRFDGMNIKQADIGFRRDMLEWMAIDPIIIIIVALDTFLCNHDRHRKNLFYNPKTDSFCAIDMDSSFKYNLCDLAVKNFTKMLNDHKLRLSVREINILKKYKEHLQFLIDHYHPEDTVKMYNLFVEKAGFVPGSSFHSPNFAAEIDRNKATIFQSYQDAKRVVKVVGQLIEKARKNYPLRHGV
ncbi:MAG TPA: hypothetical protein VKU36_00590 [Candidatus Babeliales bacterium]|nr:hypothetical protein [Candidatus Babeliales bacterium]